MSFGESWHQTRYYAARSMAMSSKSCRTDVGEPFSSTSAGCFLTGVARMTQIGQIEPDEEPMGIVISRGSRAESAPRFWAYVWSQGPEASTPPIETKAA